MAPKCLKMSENDVVLLRIAQDVRSWLLLVTFGYARLHRRAWQKNGRIKSGKKMIGKKDDLKRGTEGGKGVFPV